MLPPSPLLIAQITDTHLFAGKSQELLGLPTAKSLNAVLSCLQKLQPQPDLLLLTGDLSQDETVESYYCLYQFLLPLKIPVYWLPGNHDVPSVMEQVLNTAPISAEKTFQRGGWNFVLLNSAVSGRVDGKLSSQSLNWLEQQLQANPHPTLLALHHPPFPIGSNWIDEINLQNSADLFAVLDRYSQVKLVLFGHIHQEFDHWRHSVRYLGTPSTCVQFKPNSANFALDQLKPGFRLLYLDPDGNYSTRVERIDCVNQLDFAATGY
ncbi:3',5'-cyclic-AMP phosphodiesterase [Oculatella sp. FACHB-28]|uniref:3',5'-cyclic-AMP phosphodiesterase n=1 Tax=Oculatella sp. FACHB-28 TaxID=2692845 RepID=UPI001688717E|nr:3',5'-cyclic-AMP phosphodiesterase [Oculatella sp. FACHB-28]MBD2054656.1 3',5'-cyclic-AMP phosphodiesterase [Oculatella sp. FACHB-28]